MGIIWRQDNSLSRFGEILMKEYILLHKTHHNNYLSIKKGYKNSLSSLFSMLFGGDFRPWDNNFLHQEINLYNAHFIYHDFKNKLLYIGFGDWLSDSEINGSTDEEFPEYLNDFNSSKMSVDNFLEFR